MEKPRLAALFSIILAVFLFSTIEVGMKLIQAGTSPFITNFFRFFIGGISLLIYAVFTGKTRNLRGILKQYPKYYMPASIIGLAIGMSLFSWGTSLTKASMSAAIISANPILVTSFFILFQNEKKSVTKIAGMLLGFFGVLVIVTDLNFTEFTDSEYLLGNIIVFAGTLFWVVDLILGKILMHKSAENTTDNQIVPPVKVSSLDFNIITFLSASICMGPLLFTPTNWATLQSQDALTYLGLAYLGIIPTGFAYVLFFKGLHSVEASSGINLFYLKPVFSTVLAFAFLGETPTIFFFIGIILEMVAIILVSKE